MAQLCCRRIMLMCFVTLLWIATAGAQTVLLDDFQRPDNNVVGNSWIEVETVANTGSVIFVNQLKIGSGTAGRDYDYRDVSAAYNTVFNTNTGVLTWAFNMRQRRTDPSGFDGGNYGVAFVLGCSSNNFLIGNGYAVVLGNSGSSDNLRLVRFVNGLDANANLTNIIAPVTDFGNDFLTVKVTYNPVGNNWSLFIGNNLTFFDDPNTATYIQSGATTSDATYTGTDLLFLGCLWNHATTATDVAEFDNIRIPNLCTLNSQPSIPCDDVVVSALGANSVTLNLTPGNGSERLIICRMNGPVTSVPVDGASYVANTTYGLGTLMAPGEYVVYAGGATSVTINGLSPSTNYEFRVFEYNGSGCTSNYLIGGPAIENITTIACIPDAEPTINASAPMIVSGLASSIQLAWTRGNGDYCIVVCKANTAVTTPPTDATAYTANAIFGTGSTTAPGEYVVYSGTGSTVTVTGLLSSTTYHFAIYEFNASGCNSNYLTSNPASITGATSLVSSYSLFFGNLHAHSDYSDGDMDNVCNGANSAYCCFDIGNTAQNFDFMGIADHNHNEGPVMTPAKYTSGLAEATTYNATHSNFVALYGMEWGTISTGGHVGIYGVDQLVGWNVGNYNVFCAKGDYATLFGIVNSTPNAFASLCHPNNSDFDNMAGTPYNTAFDNAVVSVAIKNGPYNSTNTTYTDPAAGNNANYYRSLLSKGYHLGPTVDLDNHNSATMGKSSEGRTVVLATSLSRASIVDAMLNMRFYATEDFNLNISFTVNTNFQMGSVVTQTTDPVLAVNASDPDGEQITSIKIWYGVPGSNIAPTVLTTVTNIAALNYIHSIAVGTLYYFAEITEADGNISWTSPVWYTKITSPLPIELLYFTGRNTSKGNLLEWSTATELNNDYFTLERSRNGIDFIDIARVNGAGTSLSQLNYNYLDTHAAEGINYYRLKQTDYDGQYTYSRIISIRTEKPGATFSIYPNPSTNVFFITLADDDVPVSIAVYDAQGRTVTTSQEYSSGTYQLSLPDAAQGIYTLRLMAGNEIYVRKLILNK